MKSVATSDGCPCDTEPEEHHNGPAVSIVPNILGCFFGVEPIKVEKVGETRVNFVSEH
jgi:hypothetical protein